MKQPTRIVTSDIEIVAAAVKALSEAFMDHANVSEDDINQAAWNIVHELTKPPEKVSDITGFEEDDVPG
jgi:nitrate reductase alpha subunit